MSRKSEGMVALVLPIVVVFAVAVIGLFLYSQKSSRSTSLSGLPSSVATDQSVSGMRIFKSTDLMDFEITVPVDFEVKEEFGSVTISSLGGEIIVGLYGTEFKDLHDHIENLNSLNKSEALQTNVLEISGYASVMQTIEWPRSSSGELREYLIYVDDGQIYTFSTESKALYGDLDQIAKSFRYSPSDN